MVPPLAGTVENGPSGGRMMTPSSTSPWSKTHVVAMGGGMDPASSSSSSSPSPSSSSARNNKRNRSRGGGSGGGDCGLVRRITEKPRWLQAVYMLFLVVCINAVLTYNQKKQIIVTIENGGGNSNNNDASSSSAGAEEHVVSQSYGSSMYGGGIHTTRSKSDALGSTKRNATRQAKLENIYPRPDGSQDLNLKLLEKPKGGSKTNFGAFSLYAMTDTPYTDWQEKRLRNQMAQLRDYIKERPYHNITFGVHLGDTQKVSNYLCQESAYERISTLIGRGPRPTLVVPGNNDWYDCPRRSEAFDLFLKYFGPSFVSTHWHAEHYDPLQIQRSKDHPELFVLYVEGILFIGVHLLNVESGQESTSTWDERMLFNREWIAKCVEEYFPRYEIRGTVVLGHSPRSSRTRPFFLTMKDYFANVTSREKIPVLYLHGDGLSWQVDRNFAGEWKWKYFYDVQLDQSGLADPVWLDVAPQIDGNLQPLEEENEMQTVFGKGLFRIDRRGGLYTDPKDVNRWNI